MNKDISIADMGNFGFEQSRKLAGTSKSDIEKSLINKAINISLIQGIRSGGDLYTDPNNKKEVQDFDSEMQFEASHIYTVD